MTAKSSDKGDGIIVSASFKLVETAVERVITDFTVTVERQDGSVTEGFSNDIKEGDHVVFKENIRPCPAMIAITKLDKDLWYVVSSTECPPSKCDHHQAMKCARLEAQNLRIFQNSISTKAEWKWVNEWRDVTQHPRAESIIDKATRKWTH